MKLAQLAACAAALSAAGCAAGGQAPSTPHVAVAISAPTSGATVGVHQVTITGTVSPAGAQVAVNGHPAKVTGSQFKTMLYVTAANQQIVVSGDAHGYSPSQATATVSYSPHVAQQLVAAAASVQQASADQGTVKVPAALVAQAFGVPASGVPQPTNPGRTTRVSGTPNPTGSGSSLSSTPPSTTPAPTSTTPTPAPSGAPSNTSPPASTTPAPPPAPTPAQIADAIHAAWDHGCVRVIAGGDVTAYCTCTYNRLAAELQTPAEVHQVLKEMVPYLRSGDFRRVPRIIQTAVDACVSKLPPLDPLTGKPQVSQLPGVQHGAATPTTPVSQPAPGSTPIGSTPLPPAAAPAPNLRSVAQQFYATLTGKSSLSSTPAYAHPAGTPHGALAATRIGLHAARVIARALGIAVRWAARHDRVGAFPYGYRVQRRLVRRLSAALKLAG